MVDGLWTAGQAVRSPGEKKVNYDGSQAQDGDLKEKCLRTVFQPYGYGLTDVNTNHPNRAYKYLGLTIWSCKWIMCGPSIQRKVNIPSTKTISVWDVNSQG